MVNIHNTILTIPSLSDLMTSVTFTICNNHHCALSLNFFIILNKKSPLNSGSLHPRPR